MGSCKAICPPGSTPECYKGEEFGKCHKKCMYTSAEEEKGDQCSKYAKWGKEAIQGCHACANYYPGRADECMMCGGQCKNICPAGSSHDCYKRDEFVTCHKKCMHTGKAAAIPREFDQKKINEDDVKCSKYEKWGEVAVRGCQGCAKWSPVLKKNKETSAASTQSGARRPSKDVMNVPIITLGALMNA